MKYLFKPVLTAAAGCLLFGAASTFAATVRLLSNDLSTARPIVYTSGFLYARGIKISRPGATSDAGYPAGSFAVVANDGAASVAGLGVNRLDWGARVKDYSHAVWRVDIDIFATSFSATCADPPNAPRKAATCWIQAYDSYGTLLTTAHATHSPNDIGPTVVKVDFGAIQIKYVLFGADQDTRDAHSPGLDWGSFVWDNGNEAP